MRIPSKLPDDVLDDLRMAYEDECVPMAEIARWADCSRMAVHKFFKRHGVDTSKERAGHRKLVCDSCGESYTVNRAKYRDLHLSGKQKRHFCSDVCYHVYLENKDSVVNGYHQRIARSKVAEVFDLQPGNVVHHKDFNHFNTMLDNFMVFESHSDHLKYHHELRQGEVTVKPIFDGADYVKGYFKPMPKGGK